MMKLRLGITGLLLLGLCACNTLRPGAANESSLHRLSDQQMSMITGGITCKDCRYAGDRKDECYHTGYFDTCLSEKCIANYILEDTCDPGDGGTCSSATNLDYLCYTQYARQDSGCTYTNNTMVVWATHYYGSSCTKREFKVRCQKTTGSCDGTLVATSSRYNGINCIE